VKRKVLVAIVVIAGLVAAASIVLFVSTFTFHDQGAVRFGASLNVTTVAQGQAVRVNLEDWNTLDFKNSLPLSDGLSALNLSAPPCAGLYPGGIAVYEGAYGLGNVTSATPLPFYAGGDYFICTSHSTSNSFTFGPLQNVTAYFDLPGYYTSGSTPALGGGATEGVLHLYLPGVYTVIAGNPLGSTKVMYFHVTAATADQERTGPVSTFPATWLDPCNESATGNVTTGVYLGLNGSSSLDHINLDQAYAQIVNSSAFAYLTVGHGWVVSEWTESEASGNAGVGQVVVSFILTSDGVPSGYAYAYYDPVSGTAAATSASFQSTSCPA
jgi:hypothetical protein